MLGQLVVGAAAAVLLAGCGEQDDPSPEPSSYYAELAEVTAALDDANTAADADLHAALGSTRERDVGDLFAQVTEEAADRHEAAITEIAALDPRRPQPLRTRP